MWGLFNHTRYLAERSFVRDANGAEVWSVVVKATFTIKPDGSIALAEEQAPICLAPEYRGEPGQSSLRYEADFVLAKQATDVLLHGHAYAPAGRPVREVDVHLRVGSLAKTLRVFGRRVWESTLVDVKLSAPEPFEKVPLIYEFAFGGTDHTAGNAHRHNPVGMGFAVKPSNLRGALSCAIEYPSSLISSAKDRPQPAGFGPIARDWLPRAALAGTYDQAWEDERRPLLPVDFQARFCQCAPEDQQVQPFLRGGESVQLLNLTPAGALRLVLPRINLGFETQIGGGTVAHRAFLHTLVIEPDSSRLIMVWQTSLPCHDMLYSLLWTRVYEKELLQHE